MRYGPVDMPEIEDLEDGVDDPEPAVNHQEDEGGDDSEDDVVDDWLWGIRLGLASEAVYRRE